MNATHECPFCKASFGTARALTVHFNKSNYCLLQAENHSKHDSLRDTSCQPANCHTGNECKSNPQCYTHDDLPEGWVIKKSGSKLLFFHPEVGSTFSPPKPMKGVQSMSLSDLKPLSMSFSINPDQGTSLTDTRK